MYCTSSCKIEWQSVFFTSHIQVSSTGIVSSSVRTEHYRDLHKETGRNRTWRGRNRTRRGRNRTRRGRNRTERGRGRTQRGKDRTQRGREREGWDQGKKRMRVERDRSGQVRSG